MKAPFCILLALSVGLGYCTSPNRIPNLQERLIGKWQAHTTRSVEMDSVGQVLFERTDSSQYCVEFTPKEVLYYFYRDPAQVSKRTLYTLSDTLITLKDKELWIKIAVQELTDSHLVLRQALPGLAHTTLTSTITYTRIP